MTDNDKPMFNTEYKINVPLFELWTSAYEFDPETYKCTITCLAIHHGDFETFQAALKFEQSLPATYKDDDGIERDDCHVIIERKVVYQSLDMAIDIEAT